MKHIIEMIAFYALKPFILEIKGEENIPKKPCIIASNHASYIDGPLLYLVIQKILKKPTHFIMATRIPTKKGHISFEKGWKRWLMEKFLQQIMTGNAVTKSVNKIQQNCIVGIFPEGRRTRTGKKEPTTHTGLGVIHLLTKAPILPITLKTYEWWPCTALLPSFKQNIKIIIGKQKSYKKELTRKNALEIQKEVMHAIYDQNLDK